MADVDFLRRTIRVERQRLQSGELAPVKSKASRRSVPVGQVVIDELAAHLAALPSDDALFLDEWGEPLSYRRWKRLLRDAGPRAGVEVRQPRFAALRGLGVDLGWRLGQAGADVPGHSSAVITLRTYAHMFPGDEDRTRNVLDAALNPLADSLRTEAASDG